MTKSELQKELKEKVKAGVKPSDLKRLKRSKSADDINNNPPPNLLQDQLKEKQKEIEALRAKAEASAKQLKELRKQLEQNNDELKATQQELDNSLEARIQGVQQFGKEHDKRTKVEKELSETIDEASSELVVSDKQISSLRIKLNQAQSEINRLTNELKWAKIKKGPNLTTTPELPESINYLRYALYSLLAVWFTLTLINSFKPKNHA